MRRFLLVGLISLFGLISFSNALTVSSLLTTSEIDDFQTTSSWQNVIKFEDGFAGTYCVKLKNVANNYNTYNFGIGNSSSEQSFPNELQFYYYGTWQDNYVCSYTSDGYEYLYIRHIGGSSIVDVEYFVLNDLLDHNLPLMTTEQCQQEYSLMPIESCNSDYCEINDLCSTIGGSGSSTLYINDVWHEAAPFIYVNIPEEFKRDYLTGINEFTINVEGLNGDQDYINGIIDVNSYRPSSEDFTQTFVGGLTLIFPYIIITAVILFIWRFIRKIFK